MSESGKGENDNSHRLRHILQQTLAEASYLPELFLLITLLCFLVGKIALMQSAATDTLAIAVLQHDAIIISFVMTLYALNLYLTRFVKMRYLRIFIRFICLILVSAYICDVFVYFFFGTRLYVSDAVTFSAELDSFGTLVRTGVTTMLARRGWLVAVAALTTAAIFWFCFAFLFREPAGRLRVGPVTVVGALFAAVYFIPLPSYVYAFGDKPLFENFVERNAGFFKQTGFSDSFRRDLLATPTDRTCQKGASKKLNVLVVIVESLSAYQSKYFSGIEDWTPQLDEIAQKETSVTNFHANGWTTIGGLVSVLGGAFPFVPEKAKFNEWGSARLDDFTHITDSLPQTLANDGYETTFVSAGNLAFLGQDDWLRSMGFKRTVGHDDPRFDVQKIRGPFNSVPDGLLYKVVLDEIGTLKDKQPFFITAQTFWSHRPFMAPDGSALHSEEHVIRMTDRALGELYRELLATGFFQNGIMFVTGDHRAMEPYRKVEMEKFGAWAVARIPAIIVTRATILPRNITENFQQRDIAASIEALVQDEVCLDRYEGAMVGVERHPPACIMHARGDDRDLILVKCGDREGVVRTAGDLTGVVDGSLPDETSVIRTINQNRVRVDLPGAAVQSAGVH